MPVPPPAFAPIGAILRLPTPSPTPAGTPVVVNGQTVSACNSWLYLLHWDRPSRIAQLKNALGDTVNIISEFYPPGSNVTDDKTTPWTIERSGGLAVGGPSDGSAWTSNPPPRWSSITGATVEYHQGSDLETYLSATIPAMMSGSAASLYIPAAQPTLTQVGPNVGGTYKLPAYDPAGNQVTWSWTLKFGSDSNGLVYNPDPGPPFQAYDETLFDGSNFPPTPDPLPFLGTHNMDVGSSIPGITGTPAGNAAAHVRYETARKIVSATADTVNWGLLSFSDVSGDADVTTACAHSGNYQLAQHVFPDDTGTIADVETALQHVYYGGIYSRGGTPSKMALKKAGADLYDFSYKTDPKTAFCDRPYGLIFCTDGASNICNPAGSDTDWTGPPAVPPCDAATGLPPSGYTTCAGSSNNPGPYQYNGPSMDYPSAGEPWTSPCEGFYGFDVGCYKPVLAPDGTTRLLRCCDAYSRLGGSAYDCNLNELSDQAADINHFKDAPVPGSWTGIDAGFVAGVAESLFITGFHDTGKRKVNVRTFVIGLSSTVGKCELNYTAFRGRTDASAPKGDAGYTYVTDVGLGDPGDPRLLQPGENEEDVLKYKLNTVTNASGDYAFFATDPKSIYDSFQKIIAGTAIGDYATSPPVSGSSVALSNIVLISSTDYPGWLGRLRAIDTLKSGPSAILWDAGEILSKHTDLASRKIYTWNPADLAAGLIELTTANVANVQAIAGAALVDEHVIDFLRGNDGTLSDPPVKRGWVFGASINSTPAVIGRPEIYTGGSFGHAAFEVEYKTRKPVAWLGADDGMLHAFDFNLGNEILALLPPELLPLQVTLFKNYNTILNANGSHETLTGQNPDILQHLWGVANSFRFADVYDGTNWRTLGYLALGPAGRSITAIDVTHPSLGDPHNVAGTDPVQILWRKDATDLPELGQAWSVPAISLVQASPVKSLALFGSGFDPSSTGERPNGSSQKDANLFQLNALDGSNISSSGNHVTLPHAALDAGNRFLVGQQAFAASSLFETTAPTYYGKNISNLGVQADLNGQIWFNFASSGTDFDQIHLGIDVPKAIKSVEGTADQAPLYYPVAVSGVGVSGCALYSFGSGTAYEKSRLVAQPDGSGHPTGTQASDYSWSPRILLAVNTAANTFGEVTASGPGGAIYSRPITSISIPPCLDPSDPKYDPNAPGCKVTGPATLGPRTQMTAPPFLLVPLSGQGQFQALYLLFDPDAVGFCRGYSYIAILSVELTGCSKVSVATTEVFGVGEGAASGFALAGTKVVVGKSGVGAGQQAGIVEAPINILQYGSFGNVTPVYWKEYQ